MKLFLLICSLPLASFEFHYLHYLHTAITPGFNFPEFTITSTLDDELFGYYDSNIRKYIPKTDWRKNVTANDPLYWRLITEQVQNYETAYKVQLADIMERFNHTTGLHTVQFLAGCESDDGISSGFMQLAYDGVDFISLDLKTRVLIAANAKALPTKRQMENIGVTAINSLNFLEHTCIERLKTYTYYGRTTINRKVSPVAHVFQQQQQRSSSPELVCHATGFFPKGVMMSWQKDGEEVEEDVEVRETLPNQDGSFQKRIILRVSPEDLQKNKYNCVVQHSSLEEDLRIEPELPPILNVAPGGGDQTGMILGVVVGLLVLVLVVGGILMWKKKNSGFKPVSSEPGSEGGDSASNGS